MSLVQKARNLDANLKHFDAFPACRQVKPGPSTAVRVNLAVKDTFRLTFARDDEVKNEHLSPQGVQKDVSLDRCQNYLIKDD